MKEAMWKIVERNWLKMKMRYLLKEMAWKPDSVNWRNKVKKYNQKKLGSVRFKQLFCYTLQSNCITKRKNCTYHRHIGQKTAFRKKSRAGKPLLYMKTNGKKKEILSLKPVKSLFFSLSLWNTHTHTHRESLPCFLHLWNTWLKYL